MGQDRAPCLAPPPWPRGRPGCPRQGLFCMLPVEGPALGTGGRGNKGHRVGREHAQPPLFLDGVPGAETRTERPGRLSSGWVSSPRLQGVRSLCKSGSCWSCQHRTAKTETRRALTVAQAREIETSVIRTGRRLPCSGEAGDPTDRCHRAQRRDSVWRVSRRCDDSERY